jgi:Stress responsive A/B Barrel Domain
MLELRTKCVSPSTQEPYIMNSTGGRNNSPEGLADGLSHAFVTIFASEEDRAYYLDHDPAHLKFKEDAKEVLERAVVLDYEPSAL